MDITATAQMTRHELMECIRNHKQELAEKLKNGETEPAFTIGADSYTCKEWDKLLHTFDKNLEAIKKEQEEREEAVEEERLKETLSVSVLKPETVKRNYFMEKINGTYKGPSVPYEYLAQDGVISYKGVIFTCREDWNAICLGDMSDLRNVLTIPLSGGGCLKVNRDNLGDLSQAITMFSPEDINLIMRAIADDKKVQEMQNTIEEEKTSIGDAAEEKLSEDEELQMAILNQLIADTTAQTQNNKRV